MALVGDYHGCSHVFACLNAFWVSLSKPVAKQASKRTFAGRMSYAANNSRFFLLWYL